MVSATSQGLSYYEAMLTCANGNGCNLACFYMSCGICWHLSLNNLMHVRGDGYRKAARISVQ